MYKKLETSLKEIINTISRNIDDSESLILKYPDKRKNKFTPQIKNGVRK